MAAKAIAIEIGYSLTKVCEVDYKAKTHKIYKSFTVPNGAEVISDGALMVSPEYVETLRSALSANHVRVNRWYLQLPPQRLPAVRSRFPM